MSPTELVALVCCDLGSIVRGRSLPTAQLGARLQAGVGWVPANMSITPLGTIAEETPFGSTGDLRLLPDAETQVRVEVRADESALEFVLCDIAETDGSPWECCPRRFLRDALEELDREYGLRVLAGFEHEFQLLSDSPPSPPFSLEAQRRFDPLGPELLNALLQGGVQPELLFAEYAPHQFEIPVTPAEGLASADRSVVLKEVVRDVARRHGLRASFAPLLDPASAGNGVHIHLSLADGDGRPALYDATRPGRLSELGERFAAGILLHADALSALTAPSPLSAMRLTPHRWSVGAVCLGQANREALLRIPSIVELGGAEPAVQLRLEYRAADATANPYLALGALVRAGVDGLRAQLPAPPILDRDPSALDEDERELYRVGAMPESLDASLEALARDETVRGWLKPLLYDAFVGVKHSELQAAEGVDIGELCRRYAAIY
ncbi:MAG TPA: glutamine synthetase family protein [Solirubrobacteraceae bacterium]|nr:glutamine synthetase family protein [Solirubrobacteraceae bacterium]